MSCINLNYRLLGEVLGLKDSFRNISKEEQLKLLSDVAKRVSLFVKDYFNCDDLPPDAEICKLQEEYSSLVANDPKKLSFFDKIKKLKMLEILLEKKAKPLDFFALGDFDESILLLAITNSSLEVIEFLLSECMLKVNLYVITFAIKNFSSLDVIDLLLKYTIPVEKYIRFAIYNKRDDLVRMLIKKNRPKEVLTLKEAITLKMPMDVIESLLKTIEPTDACIICSIYTEREDLVRALMKKCPCKDIEILNASIIKKMPMDVIESLLKTIEPTDTCVIRSIYTEREDLVRELIKKCPCKDIEILDASIIKKMPMDIIESLLETISPSAVCIRNAFCKDRFDRVDLIQKLIRKYRNQKDVFMLQEAVVFEIPIYLIESLLSHITITDICLRRVIYSTMEDKVVLIRSVLKHIKPSDYLVEEALSNCKSKEIVELLLEHCSSNVKMQLLEGLSDVSDEGDFEYYI